MAKKPGGNNKGLKRVLGLRDLVLFNIASVIGLSSLTQAAQFGWSSFPLWILAAAFFLIPLGLAVADLNLRIPGQGGFYIWTKKAFGERHGFIAAWTYWLSNIVWFPTVLFTIVLSSLYIFGDQFLHLRDSFWFSGVLAMIILWSVILMNIVGLSIGKWIQNIGAISLWVLFVLLFSVSLVYVVQNGPAQSWEPRAFIPDLQDYTILPFFAAIAYSFGGLELSSVMSDEIKKPGRTIIRSIWISGIIIALFYLLGTFSLLVAIPSGELEIVDGIAQTFHQIDKAIGWPLLGSIGAFLVTLGTIGLFGAWLSGSARLPFVIGLDHYLPPILGKLHPKFKSPYISLIVQGVLVSLLFIISIAGSALEEAYSTLYDMSIVLYFIPFLYLFGAFMYHNIKNTGDHEKGIPVFNKHKRLALICACLGFSVIFLSIILAFMPSAAIENKSIFYLKIAGGTILLIGVGLVFYHKKSTNK
ncbi:MAG: amino acid permease [Flavobacteriaceae bacterium]|nr:APC family permease [Bacteroidia bacterium]NNK87551.1 amino acid permease [Flavobacteriaceae bacterium]